MPGAEIADLVTGARHVAGHTTAGTARPRDIHTTKPPQPKFQKTNLQGHMSERSDIRSLPTPVRIQQLSQYLAGYNAKKVRFLISGFTQGFRTFHICRGVKMMTHQCFSLIFLTCSIYKIRWHALVIIWNA